jgi:hypothetical protein
MVLADPEQVACRGLDAVQSPEGAHLVVFEDNGPQRRTFGRGQLSRFLPEAVFCSRLRRRGQVGYDGLHGRQVGLRAALLGCGQASEFGAPQRNVRIGAYRVMVWNHDLLPALTSGFARGCGPRWRR